MASNSSSHSLDNPLRLFMSALSLESCAAVKSYFLIPDLPFKNMEGFVNERPYKIIQGFFAQAAIKGHGK